MRKILIIIMLVMPLFAFVSMDAVEMEVYCLSTTDYLNLREGPSITSKIVIRETSEGKEKMQLRITEAVRILKQNDKDEVINGKKGRWVFVDTGFLKNSEEKITGWIFNYYLAKKNDFEPLASLPYDMVLDWADDVTEHHYEFYKNGTFSSDGSNYKGRLYIDKRKKVLIIKYDNEKELLPFEIIGKFYFKNGNICIIGGGEVDTVKRIVGDACSKIKK